MGYIDANGNYYEGDRQGVDLIVPQRPSQYHRWENVWAEDLQLAKDAKITELQGRRLTELEHATNPLGTSPALIEAYRIDYAAALLVIAGNGIDNVYDSVSANTYLQARATAKGLTLAQFAAAVKYNYETAATNARAINDTWTQREKEANAATTVAGVMAVTW